jgi:hypothetical protein
VNYKHTSVSRYRISLSRDEKYALQLAVDSLKGQVPNSMMPEEITNHVQVKRQKIYGVVQRVLEGKPIGHKEKEVLVATLHYGKTLVG